MPLTRLDMVSMAPKTQEAGNLRQNEMTHTSNLQSNVAGTVQQQARAKLHLVEKFLEIKELVAGIETCDSLEEAKQIAGAIIDKL